MSDNIRFLFDNVYDTSVLEDQTSAHYFTDSQRDILMSAEQCKNASRSSVTFSKPANPYVLKGTVDGIADISCLAFVRATIPASATLKFTMWDANDWTGDWNGAFTAEFSIPSGSVGEAIGWGDFDWGSPWGGAIDLNNGSPMSSVLVFWFDDTRNDYALKDNSGNIITSPAINITNWKLEIEFTGTTSLVIDRIFLGNYFESTFNISHGHTMAFQDSTKQYRTDGGSLRTDLKHRYKQIKAAFSVISAEQRIILAEHFARAGLHKDFLISLYPKNDLTRLEVDYTTVGKFKRVPIMVELIGGYYKGNIDVEET